MFGGLQAGFAQFNNIMFDRPECHRVAAAMFKEFVTSAMETTKEAVSLGKAFGMTATEASYMRAAAAGVGVGFDYAHERRESPHAHAVVQRGRIQESRRRDARSSRVTSATRAT
jgi:hypothetical protein